MPRIRKIFINAVILSIAACASAPQKTAQQPPAAATAPAAPSYLARDAIDLTRLLPPPPAVGSEADQRELAAVLAAQESRSPERAELALADQAINLTQFAKALGIEITPDKLPITAQFFMNVSRATGFHIMATKECWHTLRPFERDPRITPPGNMREALAVRPPPPGAPAMPEPPAPPADSPCDKAAVPAKYNYSYPSGHATWGAMTGILLAAMVPEKHEALFARGWEFGESRFIGGVHFPIDVASGRVQATVLVALMMQNDQFQTDLAAARKELRGALGLPN
ncbi:MAG: phosphatase PAP2 family protein [Gammaproteobacteria bacterium]|jgi:acid phosphatase (class A)|nr:MAG: phosphatase PAP2 family protein [Gammaproteobacteria bacterium]